MRNFCVYKYLIYRRSPTPFGLSLALRLTLLYFNYFSYLINYFRFISLETKPCGWRNCLKEQFFLFFNSRDVLEFLPYGKYRTAECRPECSRLSFYSVFLIGIWRLVFIDDHIKASDWLLFITITFLTNRSLFDFWQVKWHFDFFFWIFYKIKLFYFYSKTNYAWVYYLSFTKFIYHLQNLFIILHYKCMFSKMIVIVVSVKWNAPNIVHNFLTDFHKEEVINSTVFL